MPSTVTGLNKEIKEGRKKVEGKPRKGEKERK
jgi:hypothetical protein